MDEITNLVSLIRKIFEKDAWHGPSVKEVLKDISAELATKKLQNTHSIIELVSHMTAWRIYTVKKLQDDAQFNVIEELNFPSTANWTKALQELEESQVSLVRAVEDFPIERLQENIPHTKNVYTFYTLLHGIVHHDLYHLGQIMLLKKALS